jgi:adenylylsulfate kinase-like enzyme
MIIWLTGLSGSGKTTISKEFLKITKKKKYNFINIDGDLIREVYNDKLGYSKKDRVIQIKRIQKIALYLNKQNCNIIVSALYSNATLLKWNRENLKNYIEIYVKTSIQELIKRDQKKLYSKFFDKKQKNVVGMDINFLSPKKSDIIIDTEIDTIKLSAIKILNYIKYKMKL